VTALAYITVGCWAATVIATAWRETQRAEQALEALEREGERLERIGGSGTTARRVRWRVTGRVPVTTALWRTGSRTERAPSAGLRLALHASPASLACVAPTSRAS